MTKSPRSTQNLTVITMQIHAKTEKITSEINTQPGGRYSVVDAQGKPINTEKSVRIGNDLVVTLQSGMEVVLKNFFLAKKAAHPAAGESQEASDDGPQWLQYENGHLVAVMDGAMMANAVAEGAVMDTQTSVLLADASQSLGFQYQPTESLLLAQASVADEDTKTQGEATLPANPSREDKSLNSAFALLGALFALEAGGNGISSNNIPAMDKTVPNFSTGGIASAIAENVAISTVVYTAQASDEGGGAITYSLKAGVDDADSFNIDSSSGAVTFKTSPDYETKPSYSFTVVATDAAGNHTDKVVTLAISNVDEVGPVFSSGSTATAIAENSGAGQVVYTAAATDSDFNAPATASSVTYSLKANTGDASAFSIDSSTGAVTLTANPDFETKPSYSFTVVATDAAGNNTEKPVTLAITNVDEVGPVFSSSATATAIAENSGAGQAVYNAAATDSDFNAPATASSVTYSLKPNTGDASAFSINSSTGVVTLTANPDYETKSSYSFTVVATDAAGNNTEKPVTLAITNVDEVGPVFSSSATATAIAENSSAGQAVYNAVATDSDFNSPNTANSVTYTLKANTGDASAFSINSGTGVVTLTASPDFETKSSYSFTVVATDAAGNNTEKPVTLAITNVDEVAPVFSSSGTATAIAENSGAGQAVYNAAATDSDFNAPATASSVTYTLKANTGDDSAFSIDSSTGAVTLTANPNYETKSSYSFTVVATDAAGNNTEKPVTLAISNVDEVAPIFSSGSTATAIAENSGAAQEVYTAAATDSDFNAPATASSVTYSLKANTGDANAFSIDSSTGVVTLTASPDFETKSSYSFTVVATDAAGNNTEKPVTLAITNVDEVGPVFSSSATATAIAENSGAGQAVYTAAATDSDFNSPNTASSVTYSLKANTGDANAFSIDSSTGAVTLTASPDYETKSSYSFTVVATDAAGNNTEKPVTLAISNVDEVGPVFSSSATATAIAENSSAGQAVYNAAATDSDFNAPATASSVTYSLKANTGDASAFSIDSSTGAVTLTASPDFETKSSYSFTVVATDAAGNNTEKPVTLAITNVDEVGPVFSSSATATAIAENSSAGQAVYNAAATDSDFNAPATASSVTYSLKANTGDASAFSIDSSIGVVTLTANPDFETKSSYSFTVVATDAAGNNTEKPVTLAISNVDEVGPVFSSSATATAIAENSGAAQVVYTAAATDSDFNSPNTANSISYSLKANTGDASDFSIDNSTGAVTLTANPNYETKSSYSFTVVATDTAGNQQIKDITASISDVNEAPVNNLPANALAAIMATALPISGISVSDADASPNGIASVELSVTHGTLSVSSSAVGGLAAAGIGGNDSASLTLTGSQIAINATLATLSYTSSASYVGTDTLTVLTTDGGTPARTDTDSVSINVTDASAPAAPSLLLAGDTGASTTDGITMNRNVNVTLAEAGGTWEYSTDSGTTWTAGSSSSFLLASDQTYAAGVIQARQIDASNNIGAVGSIATAVTVDSTPPSINSTLSVAENTTAVATLSATDSLSSSGLVWSLESGGTDNALFELSSAGELSFKSVPNYEDPHGPAYSIKVGVMDAAGNQQTQDITVNITNVNEAPSIGGIPASSQTISINLVNSLDDFTVADVDSTPLYVTLTPSSGGSIGGFTAGNVDGLTIAMDGNQVQLTGSATSINNALANATFSSSTTGTASVTVRVSDSSLADTAAESSSTATYNFSSSVPQLRIASGQDAFVNSSESGVDVELSIDSLVSGDTVSLKLGADILGSVHTVTAAEASTHMVSLNIAKADLSGEGQKNIYAELTQGVSTTSNSNTLGLTLDLTPPATGSLQWLLGKAVNPVANLAEVSTGAVLFQSTEVDTIVKVTFTDSASHSLVKSVISTGKIQAVTLEASDFGTGTGQLSNGNITVTATVNDVAGNAVDGYAKTIVPDGGGSQYPANERSFTLDVTAPQIQTAKVVDKILVLQLDDVLATDAAHKPNLTDFTVTVNGSSNAVTGIRILGSSLELTLTNRVAPGATVSLGYTAPTMAADSSSGPLQDQAGNPLANISNLSVTDSTPNRPVITSIVLKDNSGTGTDLSQFFGKASAGGHTAQVTFSEPVNIAGGSVTLVFGDKNDHTRSFTGTIAADASGSTFSATKDVTFTGVLPTLSNVEFMLDLLSVNLNGATITGNTIANGGSGGSFDAANPSIGDIHTGYTADYIKPEIIDKGADIYAVDSSNNYINPLERSALKVGDKIVVEVPWNDSIASFPTDASNVVLLRNYKIRLGGVGDSENGVLKLMELNETFPGTTPSKKFFTYTIVAGNTDSDGIDAEYLTLQPAGQDDSSGVIDLAGNRNPTSLHPLDKIYHIPTLKVDTTAPTLDLNGSIAAGINATTTIPSSTDVSNFNSGTAILPDVAAVSHADVMKIVLDFADPAATNAPKSGDHLKIGSINGTDADLDLNSASNLSHTTGGLTLGGQSGLDYTYDEATNKLTLFKHDGTAFAAANIDAALKAIQFKNDGSQVVAGTRDFDVHLFDHAGNDGWATAQFVLPSLIL